MPPPQGDLTDEDDSDAERVRREDERVHTVVNAVGIAIKNGTKFPLEWDPLSGIPWGEYKLGFTTYIGVVTRERVFITYERWTDVPKETLDGLY
ncbi:hypothetical protein SOVF_156250 [Spinacia oleracea]|nr:hypothetical protein SOVF_156250 [Spinacia oleracea]